MIRPRRDGATAISSRASARTGDPLKPAASAPSVRTDAARLTATVIPLRPAQNGDDRRDHPAIRCLYRWTGGTSFDAAFALVACREHPADWRPELLLWRIAQEYRHETLIARWTDDQETPLRRGFFCPSKRPPVPRLRHPAHPRHPFQPPCQHLHTPDSLTLPRSLDVAACDDCRLS